ncbi:MAG: AraC family transcriptional regulator, partial [Psychrobium sp.]
KNTLGCSPTQYRKEKSYLNSKICKAPFPTKEYILPMTLLEKEKAFPIEIKQLPKMQVVYIRVLNSYEGDRVIEAFKKLIDWTKSNDIFQEGILFGMSLNDPSVTPKHLCSYDVCFACNSDVEITNELSKMIIPARDYAVTRVSGDISWVATAWEYLFSGWLIESKFEPEHAPAFERFLNKEKALDWTNFDLELCLPIKRII